MARQYKKLQQKLHPRTKKAPEKPPGKDYLLLGVIVLVAVFAVLGWNFMDITNRAMYILLFVSMSCTYIRRHAKLSELQTVMVERVGLITIGFAVALFVLSLYHQFIA